MNDKQLVEKLRQKYMQNPPEGMTTSQVEKMSDDDLLDMDYFLNEEFDDDDFDADDEADDEAFDNDDEF